MPPAPGIVFLDRILKGLETPYTSMGRVITYTRAVISTVLHVMATFAAPRTRELREAGFAIPRICRFPCKGNTQTTFTGKISRWAILTRTIPKGLPHGSCACPATGLTGHRIPIYSDGITVLSWQRPAATIMAVLPAIVTRMKDIRLDRKRTIEA
jgi:hypothetical protein